MNPRPGQLGLPPAKGAARPSYAMVVKTVTPHIVKARIRTPLRRIVRRSRGKHRRSGPPPDRWGSWLR
ncbi:hypothetical protein GCM10023237_05610 [Streptomyces coeruleoprunus]